MRHNNGMTDMTVSHRLFTFCEEGKVGELRELLAGGAVTSVRVLDSDGNTPIGLAATSGSLEIVQVRPWYVDLHVWKFGDCAGG
jgi:hypothetical protein